MKTSPLFSLAFCAILLNFVSLVSISLSKSLVSFSCIVNTGISLPYIGSLCLHFTDYLRYYEDTMTSAHLLFGSGCPLPPIPLRACPFLIAIASGHGYLHSPVILAEGHLFPSLSRGSLQTS